MHKVSRFGFALALTGVMALTSFAHAEDAMKKSLGRCPNPSAAVATANIRIIGADANSPVVAEIIKTYNDLLAASNQHSLEEILKHYNPQFISGDNLTLAQIKDMIADTWSAYPDICYTSEPIEIRVNGDWATVESYDHSTATAPADKNLIDQPGRMTSQSRSMLFFRKLGGTWEITSDSTIWEQAIIRYGIGDDVDIVLSAPEQVKAGESYSATIEAQVPDGTFTIATIDNQALIYPHEKVDNKFRSLSPDSKELQRVLKANTTNHNEIVTATLGLTSIQQTNPERPSLALNGIATVVKRVNVVPISSDDVKAQMSQQALVSTSANGKVDLSGQANSAEEDEVAPEEESLTPDNPPSDEPVPADQ